MTRPTALRSDPSLIAKADLIEFLRQRADRLDAHPITPYEHVIYFTLAHADRDQAATMTTQYHVYGHYRAWTETALSQPSRSLDIGHFRDVVHRVLLGLSYVPIRGSDPRRPATTAYHGAPFGEKARSLTAVRALAREIVDNPILLGISRPE